MIERITGHGNETTCVDLDLPRDDSFFKQKNFYCLFEYTYE